MERSTRRDLVALVTVLLVLAGGGLLLIRHATHRDASRVGARMALENSPSYRWGKEHLYGEVATSKLVRSHSIEYLCGTQALKHQKDISHFDPAAAAQGCLDEDQAVNQ